jgi:prephenate dehydrogenase
MRLKQITIMGIGLMGGSIGLAVRAAWPKCKIVGYGHRSSTLEKAKKIGAIDQAESDAAKAVKGSDLVLLCTPVGVFESLLREIAPALSAGCIVTDVGSTKRSVVKSAEAILPKKVHFVGSHPIAGSEKRGVDYARTDLFRHALCIVTPTKKTPPAAVKSVEDFWKALEMRVVRLSPEEHDRHLADVSHLPHLAAAAMVAIQEDSSIDFCGQGFLDATRIAGGDAGLWRDIFLDNADNLRDGVKRLQEQIREVMVMLEARDAEALRDWLAAAAARREKILERKLRSQRD